VSAEEEEEEEEEEEVVVVEEEEEEEEEGDEVLQEKRCGAELERKVTAKTNRHVMDKPLDFAPPPDNWLLDDLARAPTYVKTPKPTGGTLWGRPIQGGEKV